MYTNNEDLNNISLNNQLSPLSNFPLIIKTEQSPGTVNFDNYEQIKQRIEKGVDYYNSFKYSIENYNLALKHHKELKNVKHILEKSKRDITRLYNAPLKVVEEKLTELIDLIKKPFSTVDNFVKLNEKNSKRYDILYYAKNYAEQIGLSEHTKHLINSPAFFNSKWLNASYKTSQWREDVHKIMKKALTDIDNLAKMYPDNYSIMIAQYYETLSLERVNIFAESIKNVSSYKSNDAKNMSSHSNINTIDEEILPKENNYENIDDNKILEALLNYTNPFNNMEIKGLDDRMLNWITELYRLRHTLNDEIEKDFDKDDILNAFKDNVDYYTGEIICGVSNDLKKHIFSLIGSARLKNLDDQENKGTRWSAEEDKLLYEEFESGKSIDEIAKLHKRNNGGIFSRLKKQGLIDQYGNKII